MLRSVLKNEYQKNISFEMFFDEQPDIMYINL